MVFDLTYHANAPPSWAEGLGRQQLLAYHRLLVDQLEAERKASKGG